VSHDALDSREKLGQGANRRGQLRRPQKEACNAIPPRLLRPGDRYRDRISFFARIMST
jgi:hypothetical protein